MPSETTIREFLVALGFESDESQEQKFSDAIEKATLRAKLLSDGIEAAARKVFESVNDMADRFDQLYWAAARTGESAEFIKSFSYAISQLGGTASDAGTSIKSMTDALRSNSGTAFYTRAFGFDRDPNSPPGQPRLLPYNPTLANGPGGVRNMSDAQFELYRQGAHLDLATALAIRRDPNAVQQLINESRGVDKNFGLDTNEASRRANEVQTAWTKLMNDWGAFGDSLAARAAPFEKKFLDLLDILLRSFDKDAWHTWMSGEGDERTKKQTEIEKQRTIQATHENAELVKPIVDTMHDLNFEFGRLKDWIVWLTRDSAVARFFGYVAGGMQSADDQGRTLGESVGGTLGDLLSRGSHGGGNVPGFANGEAINAKGALVDHQKQLYDALIADGVSDVAARRMVANVSRESLRNPADVHWDGSHYAHGIASWDDARSARIKQRFGKMPQDMTIPEQADALKWELQNYYPKVWDQVNQGDDASAMLALTKDFESPADPYGQTQVALGYLKGLRSSLNSTATSDALVVGDSLGEGLRDYGKIAGNVGGVSTVKGGSNSSAVLQEIGSITDDISGKVVVVSTGLSNDFPHGATGEQVQEKLGVVKSQINALLTRGVKPENIRILGFDPQSFPGVNDALKKFVASNPKFSGVRVVPLQGQTDNAQHIHLSGQGYKDTAAAALANAPTPTPDTSHWKGWTPDGVTSMDKATGNPSSFPSFSTWLGQQFQSADVNAPHSVSITVNGDSSSPSSAVGSPVKDIDAFAALRANQTAIGAQ